MSNATRSRAESSDAPVRVLGRGLRAKRGVHLSIRTVREAAGRTQQDVAETAGMDQSDISRLENREDFADCQVSTLQRYVAALGGQLELVASFGDKKIILTGTSTSAPANTRMEPTRR
jgi:DNA-binding XRE family transcriptional regulator